MDPRPILVVLVSLATLQGCGSADVSDPLGEERAPIIGGIPDEVRSYVVGVGDSYGAFCTGTVISRRSVLTAGHCYGSITHVFFGEDIAVAPEQPQTTFILVAKQVRHPAFDTITLTNDLAMLELTQDAPTQPAPMLREIMNTSFVGPNFSFVGYGNDGENHYNVRAVATFPIAVLGPANVSLSGGGSGPIDATMFYYHASGKNTCSGDSGGPAFVARGRVEHVAGATSFGDDACAIDGVDARADAPQIAAFIQPMIDQFEGMDPCRADGVCDEACNVNNTLVDPDCADKHCGVDGLCVISCVNPVDSDCKGTARCGADGACDPSCQIPDPDCAALSGTGASDGGAGDPGAGGSGAGGGMSATGGIEPKEAEEMGCGCRTVRTQDDTDERLGFLLALGALGVRRRRMALTPSTYRR